MKNMTAKIVLLLLAATVALSASGCDFTASPTPAPESRPPTQPVQPPSQTQSPSPSPQPVVPEPAGPLALEEYYYMFGDPHYIGIIFFDDGLALNSIDEEASYQIIGRAISIISDEGMETNLLIIDEYALEDPMTGIRFIREGGAGFGGLTNLPTGPIVFFKDEYYYINGDIDGSSLCFRENGEVELLIANEAQRGEYTVDDDKIVVTIDGEAAISLGIQDPVTLRDGQTGEEYGLAGAFDKKLVLLENYYQFGDAEELSLYFYGDSEVSFVYMETDLATGTYTIEEDDVVVIYLDEEELELVISNYYILYYAEQDINFIRQP